MMKATINLIEGGRIDPSHRRNEKAYKHYTLTQSERKTPALEVSFYNTPMSTYCCVWGNQELVGAASAVSRGYGYNRENTSFVMALANMGIRLDQDVDCNSAQIEALHAIGEATWPSIKGVLQYYVAEKGK